MKLTPLDIRHREFKRGMRGYADVEVDEFLDEVADEYERLFKENIDLQDRIEALEEKVAGYQRIEETLQKTLINAQASAEEQKQNANKEAQLILQDAELKARQMVNESYSERQAIEQSMAKLKSGEEDFRFKFRQLLEGYLRQLGETAKPVAASAPDFARDAAAIKEAIARESAPAPAATPPATAPPAVAAFRALADADTDGEPRSVPDSPAVAPIRGPGGVQAGTPHQESEPESDEAAEPHAEAGDAADADAEAGDAAEPDAEAVDAAEPDAEAVDAAEPDAEADAAAEPDPEVTAEQPAATAADAPEEAPEDAGATAEEPEVPRERIMFGESDDLLADVDTGVNENEFKW